MRRGARTSCLVFCLVVVGVAAGACGVGEGQDAIEAQQQAIINGKACDHTTMPSAVAIMIDGQLKLGFPGVPDIQLRTVLCTGTLIAPDVVLAAAHCLDPAILLGGMGTISGEKYYISFSGDLTKYIPSDASQMTGPPPALPADAVAVARVVAHPEFSAERLQTFTGGVQNLYDVGVLFLERPVTEVDPAVVITKQEAAQLAKGNEVQIAGWGQQTAAAANPFQPPPPGTVGVKICATSKINEVGPHEMQIGSDARSARKCHGDSGGPSYMTVETDADVKQRVVGITSHAYDQTDCAKGGVDTRVDAWFDWLDEQLTAACNDATRSWCDVPGVIAPGFYDQLPPDAGVVGSGGADAAAGGDGGGNNAGGAGEGAASNGSGGCAVATANAGPSLAGLLLLTLLVWARRRRG